MNNQRDESIVAGRWRRRAVTVVLVALVAGLALVLTAPTPSAQAARTRPHTCPGIGLSANGPHLWQDEHGGATSQLARGIAALICSAADGATIDIKSWFITTRGTAMQRIVADLALMHRYHRVHVNIFVGRSWYPAALWKVFRRQFWFAEVASCAHACRSGRRISGDHSKWITVSRLRWRNGGGPAVLSTSLNPSPEQFRSSQSGIIVLRNRPIYRAFIDEWNSYRRCASGRGCDHRVRAGRWYGYAGTHVWFEPSMNDPVYQALHALKCTQGGTVDVTSLYLLRISIVSQLRRLQAAGCTVHLLLEHADAPRRLARGFPGLHARCEFTHDKAVIISVDGLREVIAGAQDLTPNEVLLDDNQMVKTTDLQTFFAYRHFFNHEYRHGGWAYCVNRDFSG